MTEVEHNNRQGDRLSDEAVATALGVIEQTFRGYRTRQLDSAGHIDSTEKADGSPVTTLDLEIERSVQTQLAKNDPTLAVYGEETGYANTSAGTFWLIDPIDGTKSFIGGAPTFSNMAVLIEDGRARAAIIYNPSRDDVYTATRGRGAYKNGIRVDITRLDPARVALCKEEFCAAIDTIMAPLGIVAQVPPSGGGDGFTKILDGLVAVRFQMHASGSAHDYAPGALLVAEAGGEIIPITANAYTYDCLSFAACHPIAADLIRQNKSKLRELDA